MRKRTTIAGIILALTLTILGVGAVLAQTSVDGLDFEAIDKRAAAGAAQASDFVKGILDRQSKANADGQAEAVVATANRRLAEAAAKARPEGAGPSGIDLDKIVADAGSTMKPASGGTPMFIAFASLSMPEDSLQRMIADVSKAGGIVVFRGFSPDGGHSFMTALSRAIPAGEAPHISIDPRLFRAYHVEAVPTYVAASSSFTLCAGPDCMVEAPPYDRISGNVTAQYALETIADGGGPGAPVARGALEALQGSE
jgi:conjugal transfer pilus assembly protein TrbC